VALGVICVALVGLLIYFVRNVAESFEQTEAAMGRVTDRFGDTSEFCPDADGRIRAERLEAFLSVRDIVAPTRAETEKLLSLLSDAEHGRDMGSPRRIVGAIRSGIGLIPQIAEYLTARGEAMLDVEMGLGEYSYTYTVVYYSWLGKSPADGPPFRVMGSDDDDDEHDLDEFEVRERRREATLREVNEQMLPVLRNQLAALDRAGPAERTASWRTALETEIAAMQADRYRLPWVDGLPPMLADSLEPFRERLEASYSEMCNALESGRQGQR
jgi:hypothetical protein